MDYKSKSSAAAMAAIVLVYGSYFGWAAGRTVDAAGAITHMAGAVVLLAVIMIAFETTIAIFERRAGTPARRTDERDALIGARSARNAYYTLLSIAWVAPILVLSGTPSVITANCLLSMIVIAELVHFGSRIVYDQRGL